MPKKSTKKENTVFVLHYAYDNDNIDFGTVAVYATLPLAKKALQQIIDGDPLHGAETIYDVMRRYDPNDPCDWEIKLNASKTAYTMGSDSCGNWLSLRIEKKTVQDE